MNEKVLLNRKYIRLNNFDYSSDGMYFVTICTYDKQQIFGHIYRRGDPCGLPQIEYSTLGQIAIKRLEQFDIDNYMELDKSIDMPNHIHMIITIYSQNADSHKGCHYTVSEVVGRYKSLVAHDWLNICKEKNEKMGKVWQRSFYDHIIRNEREYLKIWEYIDSNTAKWVDDEYYRI